MLLLSVLPGIAAAAGDVVDSKTPLFDAYVSSVRSAREDARNGDIDKAIEDLERTIGIDFRAFFKQRQERAGTPPLEEAQQCSLLLSVDGCPFRVANVREFAADVPGDGHKPSCVFWDLPEIGTRRVWLFAELPGIGERFVAVSDQPISDREMAPEHYDRSTCREMAIDFDDAMKAAR